MFWQSGAIPASTERLHQQDSSGEATAENIHGGHFVDQRRTLRRGHFQITGDSASIPSEREVQGFLRRDDRALLRVCFLFKDSQRRQIVFHLLKAGQHSLAVIGNGFIIGSNGLIETGPPPPRVKNGRDCGWAGGPEDARPGEQGGYNTAFEATHGIQTEGGIVGSLGHTNLRVGRGHAPLRRGYVRASFKKFRGELRRYRGRWRSQRKRR